MSNYISSLNKSRDRKKDDYMTPLELSKEIIDIVPLEKNDIVLDPFMGQGSFYNQYPDYVIKDWCEIEKDKDFFEYDHNVDWIISNPPFSKLNDVIQKTIKICRKGFCYIMGTNNVTPHRIKMIKEAGYNLTHIETFNVKSWFGFRCCVLLFEKDKPSMKKLRKDVY